jgi:hypothetical protein
MQGRSGQDWLGRRLASLGQLSRMSSAGRGGSPTIGLGRAGQVEAGLTDGLPRHLAKDFAL